MSKEREKKWLEMKVMKGKNFKWNTQEKEKKEKKKERGDESDR